MRKIRITLSIAVLLGTLTVVGVSRPQAAVALLAPDCNCQLENPHGYGVYSAGHVCEQVTCQRDLDTE